MNGEHLRIVFLGLSVTSSWGNGHATNYRGLMRALGAAGHDVTFLERDAEWYRRHRDLPHPAGGRTHLYESVEELQERFTATVVDADVVVVGSYVPDGVEVGRWVLDTAAGVRAFYDIDTPVTLAALERRDCSYLDADLVPRYDLYLSFTGGPALRILEATWGAPRARAFYCLVDATLYRPRRSAVRWELGYLGTYSPDREAKVERLLLEPARRHPDGSFAVAGPQYPHVAAWPPNVEHFEHVPPAGHPAFYAAQRFTLNLTRADMVAAGWSPSVRLFEAAACGVPIVSDRWDGIEDVFVPGEEIYLVDGADDVLRLLRDTSDGDRKRVAAAARRKVLASHTAEVRADELVGHVRDARATGAIR